MVRNVDVTGASGTGLVAEGVQFPNGRVVICWLTARSSIVVWDSIEDAIAIHGHDGATEFYWLGSAGGDTADRVRIAAAQFGAPAKG